MRCFKFADDFQQDYIQFFATSLMITEETKNKHVDIKLRLRVPTTIYIGLQVHT